MKLTEPQAWRVIRDAYATPPSKRNKSQRRLAVLGICNAVEALECMYNFVSSMDIEVGHDAELNGVSGLGFRTSDGERWGTGYFFCNFVDRANDLLRADYCELQAVIIEEGGV